MKGLTSLAVLAVVLLGLGSYIYFSQSKRSSGSGEARPRAVEIPKDGIEQFVIKSASGEVSTVTKTGGTWQMTAPLAAPADETVMTRLVTLISGIEITRVVDENPTDLAQYGLAPPQVDVTIKTSSAAGTERLLIGTKAAIGSAVYAQLSSSPRVILIDADVEEAANKAPSDLRDKAVFRIDRDKIDSLEIDAAGGTVHLVKQGLEWELMEPLHTHGDLGVVSELLTKLTSLQMASIVDSPAAGLATTYRLDKPVVAVTVAAGSSRETLQIGGKADDSNSYARNLSRPMVFTIPTAVVDALKNEPAHYRRKDVFEFQTIEATRLEVVRDGQSTVYEKATAAGSGGKWRELSPSARDIEPAKMDTALSKLSYLRAVTFVKSPAGLTRGSGVISVLMKYDEGKKSESVQLVKLGAAPFAVRADWPDAARLDASAYALLVASLDDLQK